MDILTLYQSLDGGTVSVAFLPFLAPLAGFAGKAVAALGGAKAVAGAVGSTLVNAYGARQQAKAQAQAGQLDLGRLRAEAQAHGFNPLTVLGATGGAGFQSGPAVPGFLSMASGMIGPAFQQQFENTRQRTNDAIANSLLEAQTTNLKAQTARLQTSLTRSATPIQPKTWDEWGYINAYNPSGMPIRVHGAIADRLGIEPGGVYLAGDDEEVLGDVGSVPGQIGGVGDAMWESVKGWFGSSSANPYMLRGHEGAPTAQPMPSVQTQSPPPLLWGPTTGSAGRRNSRLAQ